MSVRGKSVLCPAYGGGHMRMLVPVAQALAKRGAAPVLLPLNTAVGDVQDAGLPVRTLETVLDSMGVADSLEPLGRIVAPRSGHRAISDRATWLYHGLGMADLIAERGKDAAQAEFALKGRKAFLPVRGWGRILAHLAPDLLITTCAPRSEAAVLAAAGRAGLPAVCITDHFLVYEIDYVARAGHGDIITVLGQAVADFLMRHGRPAGEIRVTGNPAFDALADPAFTEWGRALRASHGWQDKRVILWPQESGSVQVGGKPLVPSAEIAPVLLEALETKGVVRTLAEPNLTALSGQEASFLAGGEFPIPVSQEQGTITVEFKKFGVELKFIPRVLDDEVINLEMAAAVSSIDDSQQVNTGVISLPAFRRRETTTTVSMRDGESFAIAGLLQDDFRDNNAQVPWLGDVPVLGALFRSADYLRAQSELVIIVSAHLVSPTRGEALALPTDRVRLPSEGDLFLNGRVARDAPQSGAAGEVARQDFTGSYGYVME